MREAILTWLECVGKDLPTMQPDESLWPDTRGLTPALLHRFLGRIR